MVLSSESAASTRAMGRSALVRRDASRRLPACGRPATDVGSKGPSLIKKGEHPGIDDVGGLHGEHVTDAWKHIHLHAGDQHLGPLDSPMRVERRLSVPDQEQDRHGDGPQLGVAVRLRERTGAGIGSPRK